MNNLPYRPCVGIVLLNSKNRIFVGRRIDSEYDAWQMPQGGIDEGETSEVAAHRELQEETGIEPGLVELTGAYPDWICYDLPPELVGQIWNGKYRGQRQKWFLFRFLGQDSDINIQTHVPEFSAWKWMSSEDVVDHAVWFKTDVYRKVMDSFFGARLGRETEGVSAEAARRR